jgi:hypothetical protein
MSAQSGLHNWYVLQHSFTKWLLPRSTSAAESDLQTLRPSPMPRRFKRALERAAYESG